MKLFKLSPNVLATFIMLLGTPAFSAVQCELSLKKADPHFQSYLELAEQFNNFDTRMKEQIHRFALVAEATNKSLYPEREKLLDQRKEEMFKTANDWVRAVESWSRSKTITSVDIIHLWRKQTDFFENRMYRSTTDMRKQLYWSLTDEVSLAIEQQLKFIGVREIAHAVDSEFIKSRRSYLAQIYEKLDHFDEDPLARPLLELIKAADKVVK